MIGKGGSSVLQRMTRYYYSFRLLVDCQINCYICSLVFAASGCQILSDIVASISVTALTVWAGELCY